MASIRLLAMTGSARRESFNRKALGVMVAGAERAGAKVTPLEPYAYPLPLYDGDLEASSGLPEAATELQQLFAEHDGLLLACPEYNGFFSPLLKNTLDWVSRPMADGRPGTVHVRGKPACIASASPGALGGIRSLQHTRLYLSNLGFVVLPDQVGVPFANKAFGEDGAMTDERLRTALESAGAAVATMARLLKAG